MCLCGSFLEQFNKVKMMCETARIWLWNRKDVCRRMYSYCIGSLCGLGECAELICFYLFVRLGCRCSPSCTACRSITLQKQCSLHSLEFSCSFYSLPFCYYPMMRRQNFAFFWRCIFSFWTLSENIQKCKLSTKCKGITLLPSWPLCVVLQISQSRLLATQPTELTSQWQLQLAAVSGSSGNMLPPFWLNSTGGQFSHTPPLTLVTNIFWLLLRNRISFSQNKGQLSQNLTTVTTLWNVRICMHGLT